MHRVFVYRLTRPGVSLPAYFGETVNPKMRLTYHRDCDVAPTAIGAWLTEMRTIGIAPKMEIVEEVTRRTAYAAKKAARKRESQLIREALRNGRIVLNHVSFWQMNSFIPPEVLSEFKTLLWRRYRREHFQRSFATWPDSMAIVEARLFAIASEWPSLNLGDYYRFGGLESFPAECNGLAWGY